MRRAGIIAATAFVLAAVFALGAAFTRASESPSALFLSARADREPPRALVDQVRDELRSSYYRPVDRAVLAQATVDEIVSALDDPYTDYLTPQEYEELKARIARGYAGVGLEVGPARRGLKVTSALVGPAREAGVRPGDVIVAVNGRRTTKIPFERALALIRDEKRPVVRLTVRRPKAGTMRFTVVREEISPPALRSGLVTARGRKVAHVRVLSFRENTAARLERRIVRLAAKGARGLVLDLRDNPGGLLAEAIDVASLFLADGTVVCRTAGEHQHERVYRAAGEPRFPRLRLVVLVNRGTASAAEILAAGLGENGRAAVAGEATYGKASVQTLRPLSNGGALKLTTATFLTPSGVDLNRRGVRPKVKAVDRPRTRGDEAVAAAAAAVAARPS